MNKKKLVLISKYKVINPKAGKEVFNIRKAWDEALGGKLPTGSIFVEGSKCKMPADKMQRINNQNNTRGKGTVMNHLILWLPFVESESVKDIEKSIEARIREEYETKYSTKEEDESGAISFIEDEPKKGGE